MGKLLRIHEVAAWLGISRSTAERWSRDGRLPVVRLGRSVRVDARELQKMIDDRREPMRDDRRAMAQHGASPGTAAEPSFTPREPKEPGHA